MKQGVKRVKFWCKYCDKSLVSAGTKCKICKKRSCKEKIIINVKNFINENKSFSLQGNANTTDQ